MEDSSELLNNFTENDIDGILGSLFNESLQRTTDESATKRLPASTNSYSMGVKSNQREGPKLALPQTKALNVANGAEKFTADSLDPFHQKRTANISLPVSYGLGEYQEYVLRELLCEEQDMKTYAATNKNDGNGVTIKYGPNRAVGREVAILEKLKHINIAKLLGHSSNYILLGSIDDRLDHLIIQFGKLPEPLIKHLTQQMLNCLHYLSTKKLVCGSVKPRLCFVKRDGTLLFVEFSGSMESLTNFSDIGDLAYTVISMATGLPFEDVEESFANGKFPNIKVPDDIKNFVVQALMGKSTCDALLQHYWFKK